MSSISKETILQLKKQIAEGKTKTAIETLLASSNSFQNELLLLSSRLADINRRELMGIIDGTESRIENAKITHAVLSLLDELSEEDKIIQPNTKPDKTIVFKTKQQQMYLLKSPQGLECYKEDLRPNESGHQWTISKIQAKEIVQKDQISVNPNYTERSGMYSLGPRKNWLYSKKLFPDSDYFKNLLKELLLELSD